MLRTTFFNAQFQMALALICMIVGVVFYGFIIASVAASLANADAQRARYQERLDGINRFMQVRYNLCYHL